MEASLHRINIQYIRGGRASGLPWVPNLNGHRADGYTRIINEKKSWIMAFEVELWSKSAAIYESVIRLYRMQSQLNRVYWLVGDSNVLEQFNKAKANVRDDSSNFHVFVDVAECQRKGWDAVVRNERSETLFSSKVQALLWGRSF